MKLLILILVTFLLVLTFTQNSDIMTFITLISWLCAFILCILDIREQNKNKGSLGVNKMKYINKVSLKHYNKIYSELTIQEQNYINGIL